MAGLGQRKPDQGQAGHQDGGDAQQVPGSALPFPSGQHRADKILVAVAETIEHVVDLPAEALILVIVIVEEIGAHHGRQGQGDKP